MLAEAHRRQREGIFFSGVIYAHQARTSIGECIRDLELIAEATEPEELASQIVFLPI